MKVKRETCLVCGAAMLVERATRAPLCAPFCRRLAGQIRNQGQQASRDGARRKDRGAVRAGRARGGAVG